MSVGYRTLSQHLNDLKKENFNLKLRIYFLEERIQQKYEDSDNEIYKSNIELKVEVESLKRELREKQQVLDEAWFFLHFLQSGLERGLENVERSDFCLIDLAANSSIKMILIAAHVSPPLWFTIDINLIVEREDLWSTNGQQDCGWAVASTILSRPAFSSSLAAIQFIVIGFDGMAVECIALEKRDFSVPGFSCLETRIPNKKSCKMYEFVSAAENSPGSKESELQELYKQKLEDAEQVQRLLESKIHLLQEEVRLAVNEANKISTLCEAEKKNCLLLTKTIEELTVDMSEARLLQKNYCTALAEKDRMVQNMAMALNNKDTVINELTKKNEKLMNNDIKEFEEVVHHLKTALEQKDGEIKFGKNSKLYISVLMLDLKMKNICRICGRELCGNQRRWIFHTAAKLNLQVVLCHVLGKEILRDGQSEFACSKCAFMLERFFRFDTVIARIEALSIERLQRLISEKDRLKHCLTSLYRKNNNEESEESKSGHGTNDGSNLSDVQCSYSALLQADFVYSGFEYWTELEEYSQGPQTCPHTEGTGGIPRKCHYCSSLRVADSDYEAVCKVPRKLSQNQTFGHFSTCTSTFSDQITNHQTCHSETTNINIIDKEGVDQPSESLAHTKDPTPNIQKPEEKVKLSIEHTMCNCLSNNIAFGSKLDVALSLVKMLDYRPVQSPKGSKIPIKSSTILKSNTCLTSGESSSSNTVIGILESIVESPTKVSEDFSSELADFQDIWENIYDDYIPLCTQNLINKQNQDANHYDVLLGQHISKLQNTEMEVQVLHKKLQESQDTIKMLQDAQQQLTCKVNAAQDLANNQELMMRSLRETLQSKDQEVVELYQIIGDHNNTIGKLQDMLHKGKDKYIYMAFQVMPTQLEFLDLQNTLLSTQMELQKKQMALRQKEHQLTDAKRSQQLLEVHLLEGQQEKETTWKHNQELHEALHKIQKELQEKSQHLKNVEEENFTKLAAQEHSIHRLKEIVSKKEQMLQEYVDALNYNQSLENIPGSNGHMLEKLRQRIRDRDAALEQAVDSKFRALEEKEKEVHQLKKMIREREQDLERLGSVLSGNEETINSLDNLVKAKDLELEQISVAYKNLQWLKQDIEAKYRFSLSEKESIILQLQNSLQERSKEIEDLRACCLGQSDIGNAEIIEELNICLQRKEKILQDAVSTQKQQAEDQMKEMMEMLSTTYTRSHSSTPVCMKNLDSKGEECEECEKNEHLKVDLAKAQEDLKLVLIKMREYQLEVSALQSIIMKQNEQLRDQAADIDTLTRNIQIKEDLIKDLQINLVDREDIPTVELLTQQIFCLKEKMSSIERANQKQLGHTQEVLKLLDELVINKTRLGDVLHTERQLYSGLMKCSTDCESVSCKLVNELLTAQAMRAQLEDGIMRRIEQLVALQSESKAVSGFGGIRMLLVPHCSHNKCRKDASVNKFEIMLPRMFSSDLHTEISLLALYCKIHLVEEFLIQCLALNKDYLFILSSGHPQGRSGKIPVSLTDPCGNKNTENNNTENNKMHNDTDTFKKYIQKITHNHHHLIDEKEEELNFELQDAKMISPNLRNIQSDSHMQKMNLNVVEEKAMFGQLEHTREKIAQEERKFDFRTNKEEKLQDEVMNKNQCEQRNGNSIPNSSVSKKTAYELETGIKISADGRGVQKPGSLKRVCHSSSPFNEEKCKILKRGTETFETDNKGGKHMMQLQFKTNNHDMQDSSAACNTVIKMSPDFEKEDDSFLDESLLKHNGFQVDLQDLGYETCGRSENEIDREEATSPEYEHDDDMFTKANSWPDGASSLTLQKKGTEHITWNSDVIQSEDVNVLWQLVKTLRTQLQKSQNRIQALQTQCSSSSHTSYSLTDEDEGWHSDTTRSRSPRFLDHLAQRVSVLEMHVYQLQKDTGDHSPRNVVKESGKYDWLIQAQARELSFMRQTMQEGRSVCHILTQHLEETIKAFEQMLRANDIDYYMGKSFREQLIQGKLLAVRLYKKLKRMFVGKDIKLWSTPRVLE
ncbi:LOW QUALITY PROTEIN: myomegalin-like [Gastrophryne carolinensis]